METCVLPLILLAVTAVSCDSHSLRLHYLGVSAPGSGLSEFSKIDYVDDQQIAVYRSDVGRVVPVAPWMKNEGPDYWESKTKIAKEDEALFRYEIKMLLKRINRTEGLHFLQVMVGCELSDDGSTHGYSQYRYNGKEYMYLDVPKATYFHKMAEAQITTQRWNHPDVRMGEKHRNDVQYICKEKLKRLIALRREDLERRVRPEVKVTGRDSGGVTKLHCLVYGFHPRPVDVKWMKNGMDEVPTYETTHILPNPDGTYQIRVTVEVISQAGDTYSCHVDHSSLEEPLHVRWEPKEDFSTSPTIIVGSFSVGFIVGAICVLLLTSVIAGVIIYKRKKHN